MTGRWPGRPMKHTCCAKAGSRRWSRPKRCSRRSDPHPRMTATASLAERESLGESTLCSAKERQMSLKIWLDGELVDREAAKVSVFDHGLLYGDGVFEGIRLYNGRIFQCAAHLDRLYKSARFIRLEI